MSPGSRSRVAGFWSCYERDLAGSKFVSDRGEQARDEGQPRRFPPRPIPPGTGRRPGARRPRRDRPGGLPAGHGQPDPIAAPGGLAVRPAARAGSPLTTARGHHDGRAAPVVTLWRRGRTLDGPISECDRSRAGPGTPPGPGSRSSSTRWPGGKVPAAGRLAGGTVYAPRACRDRLARASGERGPGHGRARNAQPRRSRWRRHCEVVQR
jgi:hypothetical protein